MVFPGKPKAQLGFWLARSKRKRPKVGGPLDIFRGRRASTAEGERGVRRLGDLTGCGKCLNPIRGAPDVGTSLVSPGMRYSTIAWGSFKKLVEPQALRCLDRHLQSVDASSQNWASSKARRAWVGRNPSWSRAPSIVRIGLQCHSLVAPGSLGWTNPYLIKKRGSIVRQAQTVVKV